MSLNYGIQFMSKADFEALPAPTKEVYHNHLPWHLMFTDIPAVTPTLIPVLLGRLKLKCPDLLEATESYLKEQDAPTYAEVLKTLIGFQANVSWETNQAFLKKLGHALPKIPAKYDPYKELRAIKDAAEAAKTANGPVHA